MGEEGSPEFTNDRMNGMVDICRMTRKSILRSHMLKSRPAKYDYFLRGHPPFPVLIFFVTTNNKSIKSFSVTT
jgi:hypothetical protein